MFGGNNLIQNETLQPKSHTYSEVISFPDYQYYAFSVEATRPIKLLVKRVATELGVLLCKGAYHSRCVIRSFSFKRFLHQTEVLVIVTCLMVMNFQRPVALTFSTHYMICMFVQYSV